MTHSSPTSTRGVPSFERYGGPAPENYERYFVPAIGEPLARDLLRAASPRPGDRVLDVACGTGIVARHVRRIVGSTGRVAGVDLNPVMLAVARAAADGEDEIEWHEGAAEELPFEDGSFDVVLCQLGLQFFRDRDAALREMRRVLEPGGRLGLDLPGPTPRVFAVLGEALARHIRPEIARFMDAVFALHDPGRLDALLRDAGFRDTSVRASATRLVLPSPDFLWQYVHSTPLAVEVAGLDHRTLAAIERDVAEGWRPFVAHGTITLDLPVVVATARA